MSEPSSRARRRLAAVDGLDHAAANPRVSARASVWLLRLALEHALVDLWAVHAPQLAEARMRTQLLVLPKFMAPDDAWRVSELWHLLSRVAHHHAYELTPSRAEVSTWRREVQRAVTAIEGSARSA